MVLIGKCAADGSYSFVRMILLISSQLCIQWSHMGTLVLALEKDLLHQNWQMLQIRDFLKSLFFSEAAQHWALPSNTSVLIPNDDISGKMTQAAYDEERKDCGVQRWW